MENKIKEESGLKFLFPQNDTVVKFDDTKFYRDYFNKLPEAKGVDFISVDKDKIAISARSKTDINVQLIMEKLGGGGHFSMAACQVEEKSIKETINKLEEAIDQYLDERG